MSGVQTLEDRRGTEDGAPMRVHYVLVIAIQLAVLSLLAWLAATYR